MPVLTVPYTPAPSHPGAVNPPASSQEKAWSAFELWNENTAGSNWGNAQGLADGGALTSSTWVYDSTALIPGLPSSTLASTAGASSNRTIPLGTFSAGASNIAGVPQARFGLVVAFQWDILPVSTSTPFLAFRGLSTNLCQIRHVAAGSVIRKTNNTAASGTDGSTVLVAGTLYQIAWLIDSVAQNQQWRLYDGSGNLLETSDISTYTQGPADHGNLGFIATPGAATTIRFARLGFSTIDWLDPFFATGFTQTLSVVEAPIEIQGLRQVTASLSKIEAPSESINRAVTASLALTEAPGRSSKQAAVIPVAAAVENPLRAIKQAAAHTRTANQAPARTLAAAVAAVKTAVQAPGRALRAAVTATVLLVQAPARPIQQAVAATKTVPEAPARSVVSAVTRFLSVTVLETVLPKIGQQAVTFTKTVAEAPGRALRAAVVHTRTLTETVAASSKQAAAATLARTQPVVGLLRAAVTKTVSRTEAPTLTPKAAVTQTRAATEAPGRSVVNTVTLTNVVLVAETVALRISQAVSQTLTRIENAVRGLINFTVTPGITFFDKASHADPVVHFTSTVTAPGGIQSGDLMLLYVVEQGLAGHTFTCDTGFTTLDNSPGRQALNMAVFDKVADGTESGATISVTSSNQFKRTLLLDVFRPVGGTTLFVETVLGALSSANSKTVTAPSVTTTADHDCIVTFHGTATGVVTQPWTTPGGYTPAAVDDTGVTSNGSGGASFYLLDQGTAGATGTISSDHTNALNTWGAYTVAVGYTRGSNFQSLAVVQAAARGLLAAVSATKTSTDTVLAKVQQARFDLLTVLQAPALRLRAAVTARATALPVLVLTVLAAVTAKITAAEVAGLSVGRAVNAARAVVETITRSSRQSPAATLSVTQAPGRALRAAVTVTSRAVEAAALSLFNFSAGIQKVTAIEVPIARVAQAVVATRTAVEVAAPKAVQAISRLVVAAEITLRRVAQQSVTATNRAVEAPARPLRAAVTGVYALLVARTPRANQAAARAVLVAEAPGRALRAAVGSARSVTPTVLLRVSPALTVLLRAVQTPLPKVRQAVAFTRRVVTALLARVTNFRQRPAVPDEYVATLFDGQVWSARANGTGVWLIELLRGGAVYWQLAQSDQPIPVQVTSKFGLNPTADPIHFVLVPEGTTGVQQSDVVYTATWFTDNQGQYWALCTVGPSGPFIPPTTGYTLWDLYLLIGDVTNVLTGPVTVQFRI